MTQFEQVSDRLAAAEVAAAKAKARATIAGVLAAAAVLAALAAVIGTGVLRAQNLAPVTVRAPFVVLDSKGQDDRDYWGPVCSHDEVARPPRNVAGREKPRTRIT